MEIVCAIVHQLTRNLTADELEAQGFAEYYIDHTIGLWPQSAGGAPFSAAEFQSTGDPITDLTEDMAADGAALQRRQNAIPYNINLNFSFNPGTSSLIISQTSFKLTPS